MTLRGVQDFSAGSNCRYGGNSRTRIRIGVWRCAWIAVISWQNFNGSGSCFLGISKENGCLRQSAPREDEMTTKDLEHYTNLVDKVAARFEKTDSNTERSSTVGKIQSLHATVRLFMKGRVKYCSKLHCCLILRNCHSHRNLQQPQSWSVSSHQYRGRTFHQQKNYNLPKAQMMVSIV